MVDEMLILRKIGELDEYYRQIKGYRNSIINFLKSEKD